MNGQVLCNKVSCLGMRGAAGGVHNNPACMRCCSRPYQADLSSTPEAVVHISVAVHCNSLLQEYMGLPKVGSRSTDGLYIQFGAIPASCTLQRWNQPASEKCSYLPHTVKVQVPRSCRWGLQCAHTAGRKALSDIRTFITHSLTQLGTHVTSNRVDRMKQPQTDACGLLAGHGESSIIMAQDFHMGVVI